MKRGFNHPRAGVTLAELLVVLLILGVVALVAAPAFGAPDAAGSHDAYQQLARLVANARLASLSSGRDTVVAVPDSIAGALRQEMQPSPERLWIMARPDGSVIASPALDIDRLSGVAQPTNTGASR